MEGNELVRYMLKEAGLSIKALSEVMGMNYQTLRNKLTINSFTFSEIQSIADTLGFDVRAIKRN